MDIPLVSTAPTGATGIIAPVSSATVSSTVQAQAAAALLAQTTVDLSPLGRFLSAVTLFQKRILELQGNPAAVAAETDPEETLAAVASSALALSDSANDLQASLINGTSDDQSLATLFNQQFNAQTADEGDSDSLAAIGLTFTPGVDGEDVLAVDTAVLQAAFAADPAATTALLGRTAAAFGALTGVAAEAGADPSILLTDDTSASDDLGLTAPTGTQDLPEFAEPAPRTSDAAFLQELLAETPKPALALAQAPPPAVAEANAAFAAETVADNRATPLPPPLPDTASDAARAATANAAPPRAPAAPELPPTASQVAVNATASIGTPRAADIDTEAAAVPQQASQPAAAAQANQDAAARLEVREVNNRIADTIAAERDASERIASSIAAGRAAQAAEAETHDLDEDALMRAGDKAFEQRRLDEESTQQRLQRAADARELADHEADPTAPLRDRVAAALAQPLPAAPEAEDAAVLKPPPQLVNSAQQIARDPAVLAAIAAYNLNAGPFAALNGRPEIAAQRPKVIPAVDSVTSVAAIETDAATSDSSRPFR